MSDSNTRLWGQLRLADRPSGPLGRGAEDELRSSGPGSKAPGPTASRGRGQQRPRTWSGPGQAGGVGAV